MREIEKPDAAALQEFLSDREIPCPACGYSLRGLKTTACPECNQELKLSVALAESWVADYVLTVVGLCLGAGSASLLLVMVGVISIVDGLPPSDELILGLGLPSLVVCLLGPPLVLLCRRRGRRWYTAAKRRNRRWIALAAWLASLGLFALWLTAMLLYG